jgi:hypothetical protein
LALGTLNRSNVERLLTIYLRIELAVGTKQTGVRSIDDLSSPYLPPSTVPGV